jgi:hypothetical protein
MRGRLWGGTALYPVRVLLMMFLVKNSLCKTHEGEQIYGGQISALDILSVNDSMCR